MFYERCKKDAIEHLQNYILEYLYIDISEIFDN